MDSYIPPLSRKPDILGNPRRYCQRIRGLAAAFLLISGCSTAPSKAPTFEQWKAVFQAEAIAAGISEPTVIQALAGIQPLERVVQLDRQQPESVLTFEQYVARIVTERRIQMGRERAEQYREILERVEKEYGVPPHIVVALWGIESDYGRLTGGFSVIEALATLAYEGRRAAFFRAELLDALRILDAGDITLDAMRGSWAGAMGQAQFMPSTFRKYAVDFDGDGRRDIWQQPGDVFASAAKYLAAIGWMRGQEWGRQVSVPKSVDRRLLGIEKQQSMTQWIQSGVAAVRGDPLQGGDVLASVVVPGENTGTGYLVQQNFHMILDWNRSIYFGVAVGLLADAIREAPSAP